MCASELNSEQALQLEIERLRKAMRQAISCIKAGFDPACDDIAWFGNAGVILQTALGEI